MITFIISIFTLILMLVYIGYSIFKTRSRKVLKNMCIMTGTLVLLCLVCAVTSTINGDTQYVWIFNAAVWGLNSHLNKKQYDRQPNLENE